MSRTFIAPVGIGLSLFIAELSGVYYTGGSLNPARSFGPCVVVRIFEDYHWIYWVGPLLGSLLASGFYKFIKMLEYETANPGQDFDENETQLFDPEKDVNRPMVNFAAPSETSEPNVKSRPISGDTFAEYRREEIPLEQIKSHQSQLEGPDTERILQDRPSSTSTKGISQPQLSAMKGSRRRGSSLPSLDPEAPKPAPLDEANNHFGAGGEDIVHGGAHYSQTANQLDPGLHNGPMSREPFEAGPDVEAGREAGR